MDYREIIQKTGIVAVGIVKCVNEFVSKDGRSFWSVDLECRGTRFPVNIRLPQGYPISSLKEFELAKIAVQLRPTFDRKGIQLEALNETK